MARLWKIEIYAYCLMDNHYHLLLSTPTGVCRDRCATSMGSIRRRFNRVHHRDAPLFRGRYKAILIEAEEYFPWTARRYEKTVQELKRGKGSRENDAWTVAIYLGRQLGGHKHEEIAKRLDLEKPSSVSSANLLMKERVARKKQLEQRVRKIEARCPFGSHAIFH